MVANRPLVAQGPIRLPAQPVTITPTFESEGLPNAFEEGASLPAAMTTVGGGDTWIACLAYSPDGSKLAVGDRPMRPLCTFLGDPPVNPNGGLIRIIDLTTRRVARTIGPIKRPRHEYEIVSLAYTPDGRTLVAHGKEVRPKEGGGREVGYQVTAWDADTGRVLRRIDSAKRDDWERPTFSRDASTFATRTHAGIRVWDVTTGRERPAPLEAPLSPGVLALSPDAKTLASGDASGAVGLWEVASGRRLARFPGHRNHGNAFEVSFLAFSRDNRMLACGGLLRVQVEEFHWESSSEIRLIDLETHSERATIPGVDRHVIESAAFSPDGKSIAAPMNAPSGDDSGGLVRLWDAVTGKERASVRRARPATSVDYTADGSLLVTADREWVVLRDPTDGRERVSLYQGGSTAEEETIALSPDGRTLASTNGRFQLWDLRAASAPPTAGGHRFAVTCLAYAPDGRGLASGSFDRTVKLWDVAMRRPRATLVGHGVEVVRVAYAPDGRAVASVDAECQVRIWDTTTGTCRAILQGPDAPPRLLAFGPDGGTLCLIAGGSGRRVEVRRWDAATGGRLPSPGLTADSPQPLAFSSDGGLYVSPDRLKVEVRDTATGDLRSGFSGGGESVGLLVSRAGGTVFQMTPDSSIVTYRRSAGVWKAEDLFAGKADSIEVGTDVAGERMTATADVQRLAVKVNGSVRVFDTATRRTIAVLPAAEEAVTWLALSPDGKALATGRANGEILIYDLNKAVAPAANP
jgi:WD40 repeat protein